MSKKHWGCTANKGDGNILHPYQDYRKYYFLVVLEIQYRYTLVIALADHLLNVLRCQFWVLSSQDSVSHLNTLTQLLLTYYSLCLSFTHTLSYVWHLQTGFFEAPLLFFYSSLCRIPLLCPLLLQVTSSAVSHSNAMVMSWPLSRPVPLLCSSLHPSLSLVNNLPSFSIIIFTLFCGHFIMLRWSCTNWL